MPRLLPPHLSCFVDDHHVKLQAVQLADAHARQRGAHHLQCGGWEGAGNRLGDTQLKVNVRYNMLRLIVPYTTVRPTTPAEDPRSASPLLNPTHLRLTEHLFHRLLLPLALLLGQLAQLTAHSAPLVTVLAIHCKAHKAGEPGRGPAGGLHHQKRPTIPQELSRPQ